MNGLDAIATAIMWREGEPGLRPPARSFRNCNPGNVRDPRTPQHDADGFSIYPDVATGYAALVADLTLKFTGHDAHGLGPESTLLELFNVYAPPADANDPNTYALFVAAWATTALGKPVTLDTMLGELWEPPVTKV